eukprot:CAMPEP_0114371432 /NCGR_PEP_ID=MMETSP0101-20121206/33324_1 /TAXON_ID=38822 ORGANISM="Pteridomonas danica, Strain PT" /NCGR_SAMPLE_ID=MMETSP0101 /ASSEMBLY_ACC=CAM_ASM_000211 /LENGTH=116 /DNA_ID=CAMNT_0001523595 /DNA_START=119 /DNA_END=469 /DNA_ORIENTATION=+
MPSTQAPSNSAFDVDTLPVIIAYRNGDLVESLIRCTDQISIEINTADVEWLLNEYNLLDHIIQTSTTTTTSSIKRGPNQCHTSERVTRSEVDLEDDDEEEYQDSDENDVEHDLGVD